MTQETLTFGTDVSRLLDIVANALYTNRDVFLRELVSNASDACDKLRYEALQNPALAGARDFKVSIDKDTDLRTLSVADNGIGMTRQDLIDHLGTIARSGTAAMMDAVKNAGADKGALNLIGRFGVGFYASFMVASKVEVITRKAGETQAWHWESDGRSGYSIREADADEARKLTSGHGTCILLHLKADSSEFLMDDKIKQVVLAYSDHVPVPVFLGAEDKPLNAASALWMKSKNEVSKEQYTEFYHHIGHVFDDPMMTSHWRAEGKIEYSALLFIPTMRPWDLYDPGRKHAVRLYVKRVYITDQVSNLIYPWLRFLRGVIDSEDLPLNISREMLQNNPVVTRIRSGVTKRVLSDLAKLAEEDETAFETFWYQFGMVLKEGLYDAAEHRDDIFKVCRFFSTDDLRKLTSLDGYIARMKDGQEEIYYITGENAESLQKSPQIEGFKARGLEVLLFTDTVDSFWLQMAGDYKGRKFTSVTKGSVDLGKFEKTGKTETPEEKTDEADMTALLSALSAALKSEVKQVRLSDRLTDSPVCLIADETGVDMHMERVLKIQQKYEPVGNKKILEINADHALIKKLANLAQENVDSADIKDAARLLYDQACIIQGEPVEDPSSFVRRMADFMQRGLAA